MKWDNSELQLTRMEAAARESRTSLQHRSLAYYPQIKHHKEVHDLGTYQGFQDLAVMLKYAAIQFKRA